MTSKILCPALLCAALSSCIGFGASAHVGYTSMRMSGTMAMNASSGGVPVGSIRNDVESDMGLGDASNSPYARVEVDGGPVSVSVSGFRYMESGSGDLTYQFGNISAGTTVNSTIDFDNVKAALFLDLVDIAGVRIAPGVGADLYDIQMTISDTGSLVMEEVDEFLPVPMVFLKGEISAGGVTATVDAGYMEADLDDASGTYWDVEGLLRVRLSGNLEIFGGYRYIDIDGSGTSDGQDFEVDLTLDGWIVGGGISF